MNNGNFTLTPEQIAQARKLGSQPTQQTSPQQVQQSQTPVQNNQPVQQVQQSQQPPVSEAQQIQQQTQQQPPVSAPTPEQPLTQESSLGEIPEQTDVQEGEKQTYFVIEGQKGVLELDLVTFREKNKETRFFTMKVHTKGKGEGAVRQTTSFFVDNLEAFEKLKAYFTGINWVD